MPDAGEEPTAAATTDDSAFKAVDADSTRLGRRLAIYASALLGLATLCSAWGAYQATRWSGVMATSFNEATRLSTDAGKAYAEGDAQYNLDTTVYVEWSTAVGEGATDNAAYIQENLFSDPLYAALQVWLDLPDDAEAATPLDLDEYVVEGWDSGDELEAESEAAFDEAKDANQTGDNYVLITVIFASVLFFAGMASAVKVLTARLIMLVVASVLWLGAFVALLGQPVH